MCMIMRKEFCREKNPLAHCLSKLINEFANCCWTWDITSCGTQPKLFLLSLADTKLLLGQFWGVSLLQRIMLSVQSNLPIQKVGRRHCRGIPGPGISPLPDGFGKKKSLVLLKVVNLQDLRSPVLTDFYSLLFFYSSPKNSSLIFKRI